MIPIKLPSNAYHPPPWWNRIWNGCWAPIWRWCGDICRMPFTAAIRFWTKRWRRNCIRIIPGRSSFSGTSRLGHTDAVQRTALAAAIEMLHLAISIHAAIPRGELEKSLANRYMLGVSILVGDYCFSQASILAARTENPAVVAAFANSLAQLSEKRVTLQLERPEQPFADDAILYAAAAEAASLLVGLPCPFATPCAKRPPPLAKCSPIPRPR